MITMDFYSKVILWFHNYFFEIILSVFRMEFHSLETSKFEDDACKSTRKQKSFVCKPCGKTFKYKHVLEHHKVSKHNIEGKYKCDFGHCKKEFNRQDDFIDHTNKHFKLKMHQCPKCAKTFTSRVGLILHKKRCIAGNEREEKHVCLICYCKFKTKQDLQQHIQKHSIEKHRCSNCEKEFSFKNSMYAHRKKCTKN